MKAKKLDDLKTQILQTIKALYKRETGIERKCRTEYTENNESN